MIPIKHFDQIVNKIIYGTVSRNLDAAFPCGICDNNVKHNNRAFLCDQCEKWIHIECNDISVPEYKLLKEEPEDKWICIYCTILNISLSYVAFHFRDR